MALSKVDRYALNGATGLKIGYDTGKGELVYETAAPATLPVTGGAGENAAALLGLAAAVLATGRGCGCGRPRPTVGAEHFGGPRVAEARIERPYITRTTGWKRRTVVGEFERGGPLALPLFLKV